MRISLEKLTTEAASTGFRPEMLEKAAHLLGLLNALQTHPFLKGRHALKGGTALNFFLLDTPRLSIDLDLNYLGAVEKATMLEERPQCEEAMMAVFAREGFTTRHVPKEHAGGKWLLRYQSAAGQTGNLEVDINFMFRVPLWPVTTADSRTIGAWQAIGIPVLEIHELAAGKLAALFSRRQGKDLFDCHRILLLDSLDDTRLRAAFVLYGGMNRKDWRTVSIDDIDLNPTELARQLIPTLRIDELKNYRKADEYFRKLVDETRQRMSRLLPFREPEREFLDLLLNEGEIEPALLASDPAFRDRIRRHPLLNWKALNVKGHLGLH